MDNDFKLDKGLLFSSVHGVIPQAMQIQKFAIERGWDANKAILDADHPDLTEATEEAIEHLEQFVKDEAYQLTFQDGEFGVWAEDDENLD